MIDLADLPRPVLRHLNGLWRRRWRVIAVIWGVAILGWAAVWMMPDRYESRAHVFVQTETVLEPVFNGFTARPDYQQRVDVMRLQLLTRPNIEDVILRSGLGGRIEARSARERRSKLEGLVEDLAQSIIIDSPRDMYFIISYRHDDPEMASAVVDAVLNILIEQDLGVSLSENAAAYRRLALQIEEFEEKLTANERAVAAFQRDNADELAAFKNADRRIELKDSELTRVSEELELNRGRVQTLQNILSVTPRTVSGGELGRLQVELAGLRSQYREDHPDIRGVVARIEQLKKDEGDGALASNPEYARLQGELSVANDLLRVLEKREEAAQVELSDLMTALGAAPAVEAELRRVVRDYEQTQKTYDELLARRDRLELTRDLGAAGHGVQYQVFERPRAALTPSDPPRLLLIMGVVVIAAGVGLAAGMGMTLLDRSFTQPAELNDAFGLPVLGVLSEIPSREVTRSNRRDLVKLAAACTVLLVLGWGYAYLEVLRIPSDTLTERAAAMTVEDGGAL